MTRFTRLTRPALLLTIAGSLAACTGAYTGPVEVTRFASEAPAPLGQGKIALSFPDQIENARAKDAFATAVADELSKLGYSVLPGASASQAQYVATIRTARNPIAAANSGGPVSVGVGGGTGSFGSGVGLGIGINLGGGDSGPRVVSELSVRISEPDGPSLWEGRAQHPTSIKSPYADVDASARTLASALFKDFPGGNGDTVTLDVKDLR